MISEEKLFGNPFSNGLITPLRLLLHAKDTLKRLIKGNTNHKFDDLIDTLTTNIALLEAEVGNVDTAVNLQGGQTDSVDAITLSFTQTMGDLDGVIAHALGGKSSNGYKEFYPNGMKDYSNPNRDEMPILTMRVNKAATKYAAQLGATDVAKLKSYTTSYTAARGAQTDSFTDVSAGRGARSVGRLNVELGLIQALGLVRYLFPTDIAICSSFFNFNLLYTVGHHKHINIVGSLAVGITYAAANRTFTDNASIIIRNKGTNAAITVWIGEMATVTPNSMAITVQPGKTSVVVPSSIGDLVNTYLLIYNESTVNTAEYEIVIIG